MTATELLEAITALGGELCRTGDELSVQTTEPLAPELLGYLRKFKDELLSWLPLGPQDARQALPDALPSPALAGADGRTYVASIAQCSPCGGRRWGPTAPPVPETLPNGEQVLTETWGCLDCETCPEGRPASRVLESIPPGAIDSPCPQCNKSHRSFVKASPHIAGEPLQALLICGQCGYSETPEAARKRDTQNDTACWACGPYTHTVIRDARGLVCYKCHTRL